MPNWCENRVQINGSAKDMNRFRDATCRVVKTNEQDDKEIGPLYVLDFNKMIPVDDPTASNQDAKWGTKWNLVDDDAFQWYDDEEDVELRFETAWAPPDKIYRWMEDFILLFDLDISISWFYDEPGMQIAGYLNTEM